MFFVAFDVNLKRNKSKKVKMMKKLKVCYFFLINLDFLDVEILQPFEWSAFS